MKPRYNALQGTAGKKHYTYNGKGCFGSKLIEKHDKCKLILTLDYLQATKKRINLIVSVKIVEKLSKMKTKIIIKFTFAYSKVAKKRVNCTLLGLFCWNLQEGNFPRSFSATLKAFLFSKPDIFGR